MSENESLTFAGIYEFIQQVQIHIHTHTEQLSTGQEIRVRRILHTVDTAAAETAAAQLLKEGEKAGWEKGVKRKKVPRSNRSTARGGGRRRRRRVVFGRTMPCKRKKERCQEAKMKSK